MSTVASAPVPPLKVRVTFRFPLRVHTAIIEAETTHLGVATMAQQKARKRQTDPKRSEGGKSPLTASACHNQRVRLVRVLEGEALAVEEHELLRHVGMEGLADSLDYAGRFKTSVSVLFGDGCRLNCLPEELEICSDASESSATAASSALPDLSFVQSCIAHVGFPDSLAGLKSVFDGDDTDMEKLLWPPEDDDDGWTAPRWLTRGDIIFFYHTKRALQRATKLVKSAIQDDEDWVALSDPDAAFERLVDQLEIAKEYAGTIFACAQVTGAASFWRNDDAERDRDRHWRSNIYAKIGRPYVLARPLPDHAFREHITISPGGANTPLHGQDFERVKELLAEKNHLPDYLVNARPGGLSFRNVSAKNWMTFSCSPEARFIDESQLRAYLLDYLLEELKDGRTNVYVECRCGLDKRHRSVADYFARIHGRWVPVEAKLSVLAERDLPGQVSKYVGVPEFSPTRGVGAGKLIDGPVAPICIAADAAGLYLLNTRGFLGCGPDQPLLRRTEINAASLSAFRERLR